ncbi:MAG TPA: arginine repressor [Acidimicrobiia bacterium]|nr:arginine repressor [Acidimicrobiia bacterium]
MGVASRRRAIRALIGAGAVRSQGELILCLEGGGHHVSQSTVSRDLEAIGARKVVDGTGSACYVVEEERPVEARALAEVLADHVTGSAASANLLVLHTTPGAANVVALALDRARLDGIAGTVAGDDTVIVVAAEGTSGAEVARTLERMVDHR